MVTSLNRSFNYHPLSIAEHVVKNKLFRDSALAAYGFHLGRIQGDYEGAQDAFSRALAIAQRQGDATLEMRTLANASFLDQNFHRYKESLEKSARVTDWVSHHDMPQVELTARQPAVFALLSMGDVAGARQQATAMLAAAERLRDHNSLVAALFATVSASQIVGDWPVTYGSSDRALSVGPMDPRPLSQRVLLDYEVGDFGQGETHLDRMLDVMRLTPPGSQDRLHRSGFRSTDGCPHYRGDWEPGAGRESGRNRSAIRYRHSIGDRPRQGRSGDGSGPARRRPLGG